MRIVFIYKKPKNLQKARHFVLRFYIQKGKHFTLRNFSWNFVNWHVYTKSMKLCVEGCFYIQKPRHLAKIRTIFVLLLYTKSLTLCVTQFIWNFWNWQRGRKFVYAKNDALCITFLYAKKNHFALQLYI